MSPRATNHNQKNSNLKLFQPAEIVLNERQFETKINGETSSRFHIHSGVPQGSTRGPLLYALYTFELPTCRETLGTFADDTAIFASHEDATIASLNLQEQLHVIKKKKAKEMEN